MYPRMPVYDAGIGVLTQPDHALMYVCARR